MEPNTSTSTNPNPASNPYPNPVFDPNTAPNASVISGADTGVPNLNPVTNPAAGSEPVLTTPVTSPAPAASATPAAVTAPGPQPVVTVGGDFVPETGTPITVTDPAKPVIGGPSRWKSKKLLVAMLLPLLLLGGAAAFYFGYYMSPSRIYSQSLSNTGKGYDKLIDYIDAQAKAGKRSYTGDGSYSYTSSGFSADGKLSLKSDGDNTSFTFDVGASGTRVNAEIRSFKSSGSSPDLYIKASGIKGLGGLTGTPEIDAAVNKLDNNWIFIDHTLLDSLASMGGNEDVKGPTREEILDAARAFGRVNQEYVFSTNKDKAVTVIVKRHGIETAEDHKTYRYTVALNKEHVKAYIDAQKEALKSSKLGAWLKKNKYDTDVYKSFDDAKKSADSIKSSDTFDVYMDVNKRLIYKVRLPEDKDPVNNYADIGLDYKGGSQYPFFLSGKEKSDGQQSSGSFKIILDADTNTVAFKVNLNMGSDGTFKADFTYKPTSAKPKIEKPTGARTLSEVLNELGLGDLLNQYEGNKSGGLLGGSQEKAKDSKRKADLHSLQVHLEAYYAENAHYPVLKDLNSKSWRAANMSNIDDSAMTDPDGSGATLAAAPAVHVYAYMVTDGAGKSCDANPTSCTKYVLTATLSDGSKYALQSLD